MKNKISLWAEYEPYVPQSILENFTQEINVSDVHLLNRENVEHWEYDIGGFIADVKLFFTNHSIEILLGVSGNFLTDAIKRLYRAIVKSKKKKGSTSAPSIELDVQEGDFRVKFKVRGELPEEMLEKCFSEFKGLLQKGQIQSTLSNADYITLTSPKTAEYTFDPTKGLWLPTNFAENRKAFKEAKDRMKDWNN